MVERRGSLRGAAMQTSGLPGPSRGSRAAMFEAENIRDWRDHDVVDADGSKIGQLEAIYVDTGTDLPAFASVRVGMLGRHRLTFVPLDRATVSPSHVRVSFPKKQVKDALQIDTDGELAATDEPGLFQHYGLAYQPGASGERRLARR
jgi:PRC-barrel domain protein